ncbi:hypothetical protein GLOIN_2v1767498 [Rhizophagus irregularis DAOM 181602=DAOM 197198]|nr:hypothetical protein GLOIN_2v1767498 [Rhizophagus irregularis DAOM 181602=DAOM 197198]
MSYSKIFSDLPELTYEVIKYFKNDFSTLHSYVELEYSSILEFKRLIHMSLFKVIIKNKVNIHTFDIHITYHWSKWGDVQYIYIREILRTRHISY